MIHLEKISKIFPTGSGEVRAVREVSLDIKQGEIFGIIGFSGAGKSTLVRCINLLERPTEGTVTVDGTELTGLDEKQLREVRRKDHLRRSGSHEDQRRGISQNSRRQNRHDLPAF